MAKYKDKKSSGCAMCKPWKHGWDPKHKPKDRARLKQMIQEIKSVDRKQKPCQNLPELKNNPAKIEARICI